jgi:NADPH2:quinone reductase
MKAVRAARTGGPEVLEWVDVPVPAPGPGEILIRQRAIGLNFIDTYQRTGLYPVEMPRILGLEAAGVVEAVGPGVTRFQTGDRAGYTGQPGAYAEANVVKADRAVPLPDGIGFETAAAGLLKGMTAEFLARRVWRLEPGDPVLVHAAAGGVGSILCQWLKHQGQFVIGTVGSPEKAELARGHGCDEVLLYDREDIAARVRALTGGAGVRVSFDSVGKATVDASLASLGKRGLYCSFGNASGPAPPLEPLRLSRGGSLYMTRPTLFDYIVTTAELDASAGSLFEMITSGAVKIEIGQSFPLSETRQAHEALEGRRTTGSTVLIP